jgi:hypothetical protein
VAIWFALDGYLPRDLDLLQHIINEIAGRERITPEHERVSVLNDEHNKLKDSLIPYRYFADVIFALFIEIGFTKTKDVVDAMRKITSITVLLQVQPSNPRVGLGRGKRKEKKR